jgi:iron complex outermembrane receptor protein
MVFVLFDVAALGQGSTGRIAGTLFDPSGAAVVGATIEIKNKAMGSIATARSGSDGRYAFNNVPEGDYEITADAKGFQRAVRGSVSVKTSHETVIDLPLSVSPQHETVTVVEEEYAVPDETAGTKTDTPLLETPMAVQVVPREVIEDRQERTSLGAVKNVSGVQSSTYEFYDQFLIRGFDSGYGVTFRNGLQLRGINEAVNMAFVDHIEVVKGPASMLYGRIEPGGFVNIVTAKPQEATMFSIEQQAGSWGAFRTTLDLAGSLRHDSSLMYRLIGDYDKAGSWVDNTHRNNKAGAATLYWSPNRKFNSSLQFERYGYATTWLDASIPVIGDRPAGLPRGFSILYPASWSDYPYNVHRTLIAYEWSYSISNSWKVANRLHYGYSHEDQQGVYADAFNGVDANGDIAGVRFTHNPNWWRDAFGTNLDLSGEFKTGSIRHHVLVGFDRATFGDDTPGSTGDIPGAGPLNILNPVYALDSATLKNLAATDSTNILWRDRSHDTGVYFQDQIALGHRWNLLLGGRYDSAYDAYSDVYGTRDSDCYPHCTGYPITPYPTDSAFSPRAGLLYRITNDVSAYFSYSKSFGSANGRDENNNPIKPQIGEQYEAGVKASLKGGRVITSATFFNLTKSNILEYTPDNFFPRVVGEARSRGLELDIAGQVTRHVSLIASYTFDQATITKDPFNGTQGKQLSGVAPHVGSLWARYDSAPTATTGWAFGAGTYLSGQRDGDDPNTWQLPGYGTVDLMLSYRRRIGRVNSSLQLNANNLFDKTYFEHGGYGIAAYGAPRGITVATKLRF